VRIARTSAGCVGRIRVHSVSLQPDGQRLGSANGGARRATAKPSPPLVCRSFRQGGGSTSAKQRIVHYRTVRSPLKRIGGRRPSRRSQSLAWMRPLVSDAGLVLVGDHEQAFPKRLGISSKNAFSPAVMPGEVTHESIR
jgi:hypothetical protein